MAYDPSAEAGTDGLSFCIPVAVASIEFAVVCCGSLDDLKRLQEGKRDFATVYGRVMTSENASNQVLAAGVESTTLEVASRLRRSCISPHLSSSDLNYQSPDAHLLVCCPDYPDTGG